MSEYSQEDTYVPPSTGKLAFNGWLAQYEIKTDSPMRRHYPSADDDVMIGIELGSVRYEFLNGRCVAMVNGERVTPEDMEFHSPDAHMMRGRARARLLAMLYTAENRKASGNVQTILKRGLGIDDVIGRKVA